MSKRKLGRFAGLVFALVVAFGGIGVTTAAAHGSTSETTATLLTTLDTVWI